MIDMEDLGKLRNDAQKLVELINNCNSELSAPTISISEFSTQLEKNLSKAAVKLAPRAASQFQRAVSRGKVEEVVVGVAIFGAAVVLGTVVDAGVDFATDVAAHTKVKKQLLPYYEELTVKYGLIIQKLEENNTKLMARNALREEEYTALLEEQQRLVSIVTSIQKSGFLNKRK